MINKNAFRKENLVNKKIALVNLNQNERVKVEKYIRKSGVMIGTITVVFQYEYIFLNEHSNATFTEDLRWFNRHRFKELTKKEMFNTIQIKLK